MTLSAETKLGSRVGHPARAIDGRWPRISHISSAVYGAINERAIATSSVASRTAGSDPPTPVSIAFLVALTNSMMRATATLKRNDSTANETSARVLCVTLRRSREPVLGSTPTGLVTSFARRHARLKNFTEPDGETSFQSMSSSGGPAKTMERRIASTPW